MLKLDKVITMKIAGARILLSLFPITPYGHQSYVQETVTILRLSGNPLLSSLYDT
jgi:hypothetical protein